MKAWIPALAVAVALIIIPTAQAAEKDYSTGLAPCAEPGLWPLPFDATFIAWNRTGTIPQSDFYGRQTAETPALEWYELRLEDGTLEYSQEVAVDDAAFQWVSGDESLSEKRIVRWQTSYEKSHFQTTPPYTEVPGCYREEVMVIPEGKGRPFAGIKSKAKSTSGIFIQPAAFSIRPKVDDCRPYQVKKGTLEIRRGNAKPKRIAMRDLCALEPVKRKRVPLGKGLALGFEEGDTLETTWVPTLTVTLAGPASETVTMTVRGGGKKPAVKRARIQRIDPPDRVCKSGSDCYFNDCLDFDDDRTGEIVSVGGVLQCSVYVRDSIKVKAL